MPIYSRNLEGKKQYRYRCYYTDIYGERKQKQSKWYSNMRECREAEANFLAIKEAPTIGVTFETVARSYVERSTVNQAKRTIEDKYLGLTKYWKPLFKYRIDEITPLMIIRLFEDDMFKDLSTARKNKIHTDLNAVFKHGMSYYGLNRNPMMSVPRFKKSSDENLKEMNIWTLEQFKTFENSFDEFSEEYKAFFHLLFWSGMRKNEARSLTFSCLKRNGLKVWRQWDGEKFVVLKTKGSSRTVHIDKETLKLIQKQYDRYKDYPGFSNNWFIFGGYRPIPKTNIDRHFKNNIKKAGLPPIRIHDLRHSHVSYLVDAGINIFDISKRLGHSSYEITMNRYAHLIDDAESKILDIINQDIEN